MIPIVFWASLPPWPRLYRPAETSCSLRKSLSTRPGSEFRNSQATPTIKPKPMTRPRTGEMNIEAIVFVQPL